LAQNEQLSAFFYSRLMQHSALFRNKEFVNVKPFGLHCHGTWLPAEMSKITKFAKYGPQQRFLPHMDNCLVLNENMRSIFTLLIYLNDDFEGGATHFHLRNELQLPLFQENGRIVKKLKQLTPNEIVSNTRHTTIKPKRGTCLVFNHDVLHEGDEITKGSKFIIRTELVFKRITHCYLLLDNDKSLQKSVFSINSNAVLKAAYEKYLAADELITKGQIEQGTRLYLDALSVLTASSPSIVSQKANLTSTFEVQVPIEILEHIFMFLHFTELVNSVSLVNKRWYYTHSSEALWKPIFIQKFYTPAESLRYQQQQQQKAKHISQLDDQQGSSSGSASRGRVAIRGMLLSNRPIPPTNTRRVSRRPGRVGRSSYMTRFKKPAKPSLHEITSFYQAFKGYMESKMHSRWSIAMIEYDKFWQTKLFNKEANTTKSEEDNDGDMQLVENNNGSNSTTNAVQKPMVEEFSTVKCTSSFAAHRHMLMSSRVFTLGKPLNRQKYTGIFEVKSEPLFKSIITVDEEMSYMCRSSLSIKRHWLFITPGYRITPVQKLKQSNLKNITLTSYSCAYAAELDRIELEIAAAIRISEQPIQCGIFLHLQAPYCYNGDNQKIYLQNNLDYATLHVAVAFGTNGKEITGRVKGTLEQIYAYFKLNIQDASFWKSANVLLSLQSFQRDTFAKQQVFNLPTIVIPESSFRNAILTRASHKCFSYFKAIYVEKPVLRERNNDSRKRKALFD